MSTPNDTLREARRLNMRRRKATCVLRGHNPGPAFTWFGTPAVLTEGEQCNRCFRFVAWHLVRDPGGRAAPPPTTTTTP